LLRARLLVVLLVVLSTLGLADPASATSDVTCPVLHSIALGHPGPYAGGDTLTVSWDATDDVGVAQVQVHLTDPVGRDHTLYSNTASSDSAVLDRSWAGGDVTVAFVTVQDVNGNLAWYFPNGRLAQQPGGESTHQVDLSVGNFSLVNPDADTTPPTLTSVSLGSPGPFTEGDTLTVDWSASDVGSGVAYFSAVFLDGAGKQHALQGNAQSSRSVAKVIDGSWANGTATLIEIDVSDAVWNTSSYQRSGQRSYLPSGLSGPSSHSFDFSSYDFAVQGVAADTTAPTLNAVTRDEQGPFVEGDTVTIHLADTDDVGVTARGIQVVDGANKGHFLAFAAGSTTASFTIDDSWAVGTTALQEVSLHDAASNEASYYGTGLLRRTPGGDSTYSVDMSALRFDVQAAPTVALTDKPAAYSPSRSATFSFAAADRDTPTDQLTVACGLDSADLACSSQGVTVDNLAAGSHELDVTVKDPQGHASTQRYAWSVDTDAPTATSIPFPGPVTLPAQPVLRWSASDSGSGLAGIDVRYEKASPASSFTPWTVLSRPVSTQLAAPAMAPGTTLCFGVRSRDRAGNTSAWSATRCIARPVDDTSLTRTSGWTSTRRWDAFGGELLRTLAQGAQVTSAPAAVRRIGVVATTCVTCGQVGLYVGGQYVGTVSLVSWTTRHTQVLLLPPFAVRSGAVSLRVLSSGAPVEVDGLVLSRT
jgi:hypothetical protein